MVTAAFGKREIGCGILFHSVSLTEKFSMGQTKGRQGRGKRQTETENVRL